MESIKHYNLDLVTLNIYLLDTTKPILNENASHECK